MTESKKNNERQTLEPAIQRTFKSRKQPAAKGAVQLSRKSNRKPKTTSDLRESVAAVQRASGAHKIETRRVSTRTIEQVHTFFRISTSRGGSVVRLALEEGGLG